MAKDLEERRGGAPAQQAEVAAFLAKVAAAPAATGRRGRLIFAMDATASRQAAWDRAVRIQADMFDAAAAAGGLDIQLVFYRGLDECKASAWYPDAARLGRAMSAINCMGGQTQIGRVLDHALRATQEKKVHAVVFVGDCVEEETGDLVDRAARLGMTGTPLFIFHEGGEPRAAAAMRAMAKASNGAYCAFNAGSADLLRQLLAAVAVYAAGGRPALADLTRRPGAEGARLLIAQLR